MRVLVRYITRKSRDGVGHTDSTVETDSLTIGRGSDADVFLQDLHVALYHAVLRPAAEGKFAVQARTPSGIRINGRTVQTGVVRAGDTIGIGRSTLQLRRAGSDNDLILEVEESPARSGEAADTGATSLAQAGLHRRRWAWGLFVIILVFGVGVPFGHMVSEDAPEADRPAASGNGSPAEAGQPPLSHRLVEAVPWSLGGGDLIWDSGPMSRAHRFFGQDCAQCHRQPFQRVTDTACLDCHAGQSHHTDDSDLMRDVGLSERRCADCHREHNGIEGLVGTDSRICADCHAEPDDLRGADLGPVAGFLPGEHPQFRVRLAAVEETGAISWRRVRMDEAVSERNGLLFPHDVHVRESGVEGPSGRERLACADCHRPDASGAAMKPVRFERDCRRCHTLEFSPEESARQLPHGEPDTVIAMLEDHYARVALAGDHTNPEADAPEVVRRKRPGGERLGRDERRAALEWADQWAREVATEVFEYRVCSQCHTVERRPDTDTETENDAGWAVRPVALTEDWFSAHRFSHDPHRKVACTECHAAEESASSEDVLMPRIDTCLQCHGDLESSARVPLGCIECHGFHSADELTMGGPAHGATAD